MSSQRYSGCNPWNLWIWRAFLSYFFALLIRNLRQPEKSNDLSQLMQYTFAIRSNLSENFPHCKWPLAEREARKKTYQEYWKRQCNIYRICFQVLIYYLIIGLDMRKLHNSQGCEVGRIVLRPHSYWERTNNLSTIKTST